jgi:hypothetical protein
MKISVAIMFISLSLISCVITKSDYLKNNKYELISKDFVFVRVTTVR